MSLTFLLVGNGPYLNRGCEAIVRGTTKVLDAVFGERTGYITASYGHQEQISHQSACETFPRIQHEWLAPKGRCSLDYIGFQVNRFTGTSLPYCMYRLPAGSHDCSAALQVGGDNYTLDYGYPRHFMELDRWLYRRGIPLVLWGASVGPFDTDPSFEREMVEHLSKFMLITIRESRSFRYLQSLGLTNIFRVADPAFVMEPEVTADLQLPAQFVGLNFSPLTANRGENGDLDAWAKTCSSTLKRILSACDLPVVLIPHVTTPTTENNDYAFLEKVALRVNESSRVMVIGSHLTAAQLKGVIAKATVFAGARTHSTIAALSMSVPTISLAYSTKAWGINEEVFGHTNYCMDVQLLKEEGALAARLEELLRDHEKIQKHLQLTIPALKESAFSAGAQLRSSLEARG
jgi:polysaccharide pyruvyl transferase WcaK-like protein